MKEGWEKKKLGEVCEVLDKYRKPITKNKRKSGIYPYYGATGILDYVNNFLFDGTYLLLGEDGAKWGAGESSAYIIEGKSWVNNHAHILKPNNKEILIEWLMNYLNHIDLSDFITGATVPKLTQKNMVSIQISFPPLEKQQKIVDYLDTTFAKLDSIKTKAQQTISDCDELKQSILRKAFEGELTL